MSKSTRPPGLPNFEHPPVSEVVLSIQFASLQGFKSVHVGLFWEHIRSKYPDVSEQGAVVSAFETFGTPSKSEPSFRFETLLSPPMPRFWFEKNGEPDLLQIQQDRIIGNWRKQKDDDVYPRYETIRRRFLDEVNVFAKFLASEKLGEFRPNQCELTYVNIISLDDAHHRLKDMTPLWSGKTSEPEVGEIENTNFSMRYLLSDGTEPIGRLYVTFQPAIRQTDLAPVYKVEIVARVKPREDSIKGAFEILDLERSNIVRTFAAITTPEMHKQWGRR